MQTIGVGLLGFGTIGAGVAELLQVNADEISRRLGARIELLKIADLDITTDRGVKVDKSLLTTDANEIFNDERIKIVIELIGGYGVAKRFIERSFETKKSVVTANKALLAVHGAELMSLAAKSGCDIAFEAAVGGGIPILRALREGMAANRIHTIYGILNGTTNYILTAMKEKGQDFEEVLREAQKLGYAEADPTFDVEGIDAAHKLTLLSTMAFGRRVDFKSVYTEGISNITPQDISYAQEFGLEVKLLCIAKFDGEKVEARVHPTMIPSDHLLASVRGVYNAIYVDADFLGPTLYYGQGAGRRATASAVVGDLIELSRDIMNGVKRRVPPMAFLDEEMTDAVVKPMGEVGCRYYVRFLALDQPGVLSKISGALGDHGISIESVVQKGRSQNHGVPLVLKTHEAKEADFMGALLKIKALGVCNGDPVVVRIEG
ncbi:homoserine dehydrogenase [bacterium]|nr:MAG: homoserine dehydrogenase [bacterium]